MKQKTRLAFVHVYDYFGPDGALLWTEEVANLMPQVGVDYAAKAMFGDVAPISAFYAGLFLNDVLPTAPLTAADIPTTLGEFVSYSEAARPLWNRAYDDAGTMTNASSRAVFTITADARLYGGFLVSSSVKGGNTGLLLSVARFSTPRDVTNGGTFRVAYGLTLVPTNVT
jgi:hypothetical protein